MFSCIYYLLLTKIVPRLVGWFLLTFGSQWSLSCHSLSYTEASSRRASGWRLTDTSDNVQGIWYINKPSHQYALDVRREHNKYEYVHIYMCIYMYIFVYMYTYVYINTYYWLHNFFFYKFSHANTHTHIYV